VNGTGRGARIVAALKSRPILCLALLTPGLPEYLSSSSSLLALVVNPAWFFLALAINVGQYTGGALLIREAALRWKKGWMTVGLLSVAYGITEEGLGDNTLFNSKNGAEGVLGHFGRFAGVNWVWAGGVLTFHAVYSIGLPLILLGLALPSTRGRTLVGRRGIAVCLTSLILATVTETAIVLGADHFWMGDPRLLGSLGAIAALVAAAYAVPAGWARPRGPAPTLRAGSATLAGFFLFPTIFVSEYALQGSPAAAPLAVALTVLAVGLFLEGLRRTLGQRDRDHLLVALAVGLVAFLAGFGLLLSHPPGLTAPLVILAALFLLRLSRAYPSPSPPGPPPGAILS